MTRKPMSAGKSLHVEKHEQLVQHALLDLLVGLVAQVALDPDLGLVEGLLRHPLVGPELEVVGDDVSVPFGRGDLADACEEEVVALVAPALVLRLDVLFAHVHTLGMVAGDCSEGALEVEARLVHEVHNLLEDGRELAHEAPLLLVELLVVGGLPLEGVALRTGDGHCAVPKHEGEVAHHHHQGSYRALQVLVVGDFIVVAEELLVQAMKPVRVSNLRWLLLVDGNLLLLHWLSRHRLLLLLGWLLGLALLVSIDEVRQVLHADLGCDPRFALSDGSV